MNINYNFQYPTWCLLSLLGINIRPLHCTCMYNKGDRISVVVVINFESSITKVVMYRLQFIRLFFFIFLSCWVVTLFCLLWCYQWQIIGNDTDCRCISKTDLTHSHMEASLYCAGWHTSRIQHFYPRDAMLARVIGIATCLSVHPSVCLSVRLSVTRRYCVKMKKASGMISSPSGSPKTLVLRCQISSPNSKGFPPSNGGLKHGSVEKI